MIEKEKAIRILEDMNIILNQKDWSNELKEKIQQYKKELNISFIVKD